MRSTVSSEPGLTCGCSPWPPRARARRPRADAQEPRGLVLGAGYRASRNELVFEKTFQLASRYDSVLSISR